MADYSLSNRESFEVTSFHTVESAKPRECPVCHEIFSNQGSLARHLLTHTGERPFECKFCGMKFRQRYHVYVHQKAKHPTELLKFECDECHEEFPSKSALRLHKKQHAGAHECEFCCRVFTKKQMLTVHKRTHTGEKPFACDLCPMAFSLKYFLNQHMKRHAIEKPFKCDLCDLYFSTRAAMTGHHTRVHAEKRSEKRTYRCEECSAVFDKATKLRNHLKSHVGLKRTKRYSCEFCDKVVEGYDRFLAHKRLHTGEKPYACELCGKAFRGAYNLRRHTRIHSSGESGNFELQEYGLESDSEILRINEDHRECPICHVQFKNRFLLRKHMSAHPSGKLYGLDVVDQKHKCEVCGRTFLAEGHLRLHKCRLKEDVLDDQNRKETSYKPVIITLQANDAKGVPRLKSGKPRSKVRSEFMKKKMAAHNNSVKEFACSECGEIFSSQLLLNVHEQSHSSKCFTCKVCSRGFAASRYLNVHMKTHSTKHVYSCKVCGRCFSSLYRRDYHERSHMAAKPFVCDICGKGFAQKLHMNVHRRTHTGIKPYRCEFCDKRFAQLASRNVHRQTHHHSLNSQTCDVCTKKFISKNYLNIHKNSHTGKLAT